MDFATDRSYDQIIHLSIAFARPEMVSFQLPYRDSVSPLHCCCSNIVSSWRDDAIIILTNQDSERATLTYVLSVAA